MPGLLGPAAAAGDGPPLADLRGHAGTVGGGDISIESYELAVGERLSVPAKGAIVRLLRTEGDPAQLDEIIDFYRPQALPATVGPAGLCCTFSPRGTGRCRNGSASTSCGNRGDPGGMNDDVRPDWRDQSQWPDPPSRPARPDGPIADGSASPADGSSTW